MLLHFQHKANASAHAKMREPPHRILKVCEIGSFPDSVMAAHKRLTLQLNAVTKNHL